MSSSTTPPHLPGRQDGEPPLDPLQVPGPEDYEPNIVPSGTEPPELRPPQLMKYLLLVEVDQTGYREVNTTQEVALPPQGNIPVPQAETGSVICKILYL